MASQNASSGTATSSASQLRGHLLRELRDGHELALEAAGSAVVSTSLRFGRC